MPVSPTRRAKILAEARYCCGYCLTQQLAINWLLEVEHIIPTAAGGTDDEENLWFSCTACNRYTSRQVPARDRHTGRLVRLFNPRRQQWRRHVQWRDDGTELIGLTACERATVEALKLHNTPAKHARALWRDAGIHPPRS